MGSIERPERSPISGTSKRSAVSKGRAAAGGTVPSRGYEGFFTRNLSEKWILHDCGVDARASGGLAVERPSAPESNPGLMKNQNDAPVTQGATLRVLAARLGLGKSTVQRALNDSPRVSAETRKRVREAAEALGYRNDPFFAALASRRRAGRQNHVRVDYVMVRGLGEHQERGSPSHDPLEEAGARMGYHVVCSTATKGERPESFLRRLWMQGSSGFLVGWPGEAMARAMLDFGRVPILALHREEALPLHTVRFDVAEAVRLCWERLWAAGWRKIGCAVMRHAETIKDDHDRLGAAMELIMTRAGARDRVPPLTCGFWDKGAYLAWLREHQPEAVIGFSAWIGLLHREHGFGHIPFVTLHTANAPKTRDIPGTFAPRDTWARQALLRLDAMIRHGEIGVPEVPVHTVLPFSWASGHEIPRAKGRR